MSKLKRTRRIAGELNVALSSTVLRLDNAVSSLKERITGWQQEADFHNDQAGQAARVLADVLLDGPKDRKNVLLRRYQQHRGRSKMAREFVKSLEQVGGDLVSAKHVAAQAVVNECEI